MVLMAYGGFGVELDARRVLPRPRSRAVGSVDRGVVRERRECFVVTNMRVFRLHGVLSTTSRPMPLTRILDISVDKPLHGRMLGFGHFIFESAAQEQGLREIRYVARADERELTIQRVVQRIGHPPAHAVRGPR